MKRPKVEEFARALPAETTNAVRAASAAKVTSRWAMLRESFGDPEPAREYAAGIKSFVLDNLKNLLIELEARCQSHGIQVHWASDAESARQIILRICSQTSPHGGIVVKGKSMATEEIHLNHALEEAGYTPVETDLGEYVVQIDHDTPSHIVTPIIHKTRRQVAESFAREGLGPYTEEATELTMQARSHLREQFQKAIVGVSGINFAIAETGRLVIIENEGNNRLSTTAPPVHIAVMGIEKILPKEESLGTFLKLLAGSGTGQQTTVYTHLISGPRQSDEEDGPREVHLVLLDNGRSKIVNGPYKSILRCIRCGACLNVCPVYRQVSGHAYRHVYPGPVGAVLAPALEGVESFGDLAKASSLCGACEEICPVKIPIPDMLLELRNEAVRKGVDQSPIPWKTFAFGATDAGRWKAGLTMLPMASELPSPMKSLWIEFRELPVREGRTFRKWWAGKK